MTTYLYCRVSTGAQEREGHSLESQGEACLRMADSLGLELGEATNCGQPGVFVDATSAYKNPLSERIGGQLLISNLKKDDTVIMYAIDRGWRSMWQCAQYIENWQEMGVNLRFVAYNLDLSTANGKLTAHIMAAYAQWKSEIVSERGREFRAARKKGLIEETSRTKRSRVIVASPEMRAASIVLRPVKSKQEDVASVVTKVYGYVRVSTDDQSVESQIGPVQQYMDRISDEWTEPAGIIRDEGVSALKVDFADRPGASCLLSGLKRGDHIVFLRPARAFRSLRDMVNMVDTIHKMGVTIHLAEGAMKSGDMSFDLSMQIMVLMAQIESEENSRRVRDIFAHMWEVQKIPLASCNLPPWLRFVNIDADRRHIVPVEEYLADCRMVDGWFKEGKSAVMICGILEKIVAEREHRIPMPLYGMQYSLCVRRYNKMMKTATEYDKVKQQPWLDRIDKAKKDKTKNTMVLPKYRQQKMRIMQRHLGDYARYVEVLNDEGMEHVSKAIQPELSKSSH
ncbi:MAG: recombinase family protein [Planctomycetaceae bacterium]